VFHISIWGGLELCLGAKPTKAPRGDGTALKCRLLNRINFDVIDGASAKLKGGHVKRSAVALSQRWASSNRKSHLQKTKNTCEPQNQFVVSNTVR